MARYKVYLDELTTFNDIIAKVDHFGVGFIAVVNRDEVLYGIVTDGDIRKGLLQNKSLVNEIINNNPFTLPETSSQAQIISFLKSKRRVHIPLIDEKGVLKEVFYLNEITKNDQPNKVVIMAGGLGSRLGQLTKEIPKPMLEIKGRPILLYIIDSFKNQGFHNFIFCVNYQKEVIMNYFGDGTQFNCAIEYIIEEKRLGTAGALSLIDTSNVAEPLFVANGDVISNINYQNLLEYFELNNAEAVMCVKQLSHTNPYAEVHFDDDKNLISLKEKPTTNFHINLGVYLISPRILELLAKNEFYDMPSLFEKAIKEQASVKIYNVDEDWVDIGKPVDYERIKND